MVEASSLIPATMGKMEKLAGLNKQSFTEYVVCPKCIAAYLNTKIAYKLLMESKLCCHVEFPNHPQRSRRQPLLLKSHKTKKRTVLTPIRTGRLKQVYVTS